MTTLANRLDPNLKRSRPTTARDARKRGAEIIQLADPDALDLLRSRSREQEVMDLLDVPLLR